MPSVGNQDVEGVEMDAPEMTVAEFERLLVGRWPKGEHYYHVVYRAGKWRLTVFQASPIESVAGLKADTLTELAAKLANGEGDK